MFVTIGATSTRVRRTAGAFVIASLVGGFALPAAAGPLVTASSAQQAVESASAGLPAIALDRNYTQVGSSWLVEITGARSGDQVDTKLVCAHDGVVRSDTVNLATDAQPAAVYVEAPLVITLCDLTVSLPGYGVSTAFEGLSTFSLGPPPTPPPATDSPTDTIDSGTTTTVPAGNKPGTAAPSTTEPVATTAPTSTTVPAVFPATSAPATSTTSTTTTTPAVSNTSTTVAVPDSLLPGTGARGLVWWAVVGVVLLGAGAALFRFGHRAEREMR